MSAGRTYAISETIRMVPFAIERQEKSFINKVTPIAMLRARASNGNRLGSRKMQNESRAAETKIDGKFALQRIIKTTEIDSNMNSEM